MELEILNLVRSVAWRVSSHNLFIGYFRFGKERVNDCPVGLEYCPCMDRAPLLGLERGEN